MFATLCHEVAHLYLGHLGPDPLQNTPDERGRPRRARWPDRSHSAYTVREIESESVAFLACTRAGIVSPNAEYIASFVDGNPEALTSVSIDMMVAVASKIEALGGR